MSEPESRPYVNEYQQWLGESETAGKLLNGWHIVGVAILAISLLMHKWFLLMVGIASLLISTHIHFWRDELAPDLREKIE